MPRGILAQIAWGSRLRYVFVMCLCEQSGFRTEDIGGCVPSDVPVESLSHGSLDPKAEIPTLSTCLSRSVFL